MEDRALCTSLLMIIMIPLGGQKQIAGAVSLSIVPNRSQFFEYESVTFYCEGVVYCEVVHKFNGKIESCGKTKNRTPTGSSCTITNVYTEDSGEYWCETEGGKRSNIINISVTAGSVILESPAVPVFIEEIVTLHCRKKIASSNFTADFYKDGRHIHRSATGNMNIHRVSNSDEGLYKCSISGAGESPESWLKVTASRNVNSITNPDGHTEVSHSSSAATAWIVATILFIALLMVTAGLYRFGKGRWNRALLCQSTQVAGSESAEDEKVYIEASAVTASRATYSVVRKNRKKEEDEDGSSSRPIYYVLDQQDTQLEASGTITEMSSAGIYQPIGEDPFYSTIQ